MTERPDYIVIGAGSAGCVLANRLTEDPTVRVTLLEAGGRDSNPWIHVPVGYVKTLDNPALNWRFETEPEAGTENRRISIPRGRVLGGSSSINGMAYVRGQARDYDGWAQLGCRGWSWDDVLPYFLKSMDADPALPGGRNAAGGPLRVEMPRSTYPVIDKLIRSCGNAGIPHNPDYNGGQQEGVSYCHFTQRRGRRESAATAFLNPAKRRPNLAIETDARAAGLIIENRRVVGVRWLRDGAAHETRAGREVILAAGAVQTPQILELSGIGDPAHLKSIGIETVHALPGVGENYQDHYVTRLSWELRDCITLNQSTRGWRQVMEAIRFGLTRRGVLTLSPSLAVAFVKTRPEVETPDVQFTMVHASFSDPVKRILDREPGLTIAPCQLRPQSRGSIHAASPDPRADPAIRPNFLAEETDRRTLADGMKVARRVLAENPLAAHVVRERRPGPEAANDADLIAYARETGVTLYHPVGTAKMGSADDRMAVTDDRLKVHGLDGLRIVDASVMPRLVSGNTNAPVMMIAEKAADMIKADAKA
ncbi:MAG: GMC family oxidoreductase N-terminal domain-containing protein [Alphaproteobacteria bacterium]|nr:GMC family oxidoreductase N-terminal domain-containing protein [Alphaproteobacteria bacterium]